MDDQSLGLSAGEGEELGSDPSSIEMVTEPAKRAKFVPTIYGMLTLL